MAYKLKVGPAQGLKLKGNAGFALPLLGGDAISTTKTGGLWRVDIDYSEVQTGSTVNDATAYMLTWDSASGLFTRLNVTDLKVEFQGTFDGYYQPLDATLTALAALDSTAGLLVQTGEDTFARRTLTGTANEITVTNGAGTAGNPTVSLPASLTFTGKTVTGGTFESPAINTPTGIVKVDVGLGNVDNTSDADKPISTATQDALDLKADISSLGTAAAADTTDFATAAQGATADTAVQPGDLGDLAAKDAVAESDLSLTDVTTGDVSTTKHGFAPKLPDDATKYLDGTGNYSVPAGGGGGGGGDMLSTNNLGDVENILDSQTNLGIKPAIVPYISNMHWDATRGHGWMSAQTGGEIDYTLSAAASAGDTSVTMTGTVPVTNELLVFTGVDGDYYSVAVSTVSGSTVNLRTPLPVDVAAGTNAHPWWTGEAHPTSYGCRAIVAYALRDMTRWKQVYKSLGTEYGTTTVAELGSDAVAFPGSSTVKANSVTPTAANSGIQWSNWVPNKTGRYRATFKVNGNGGGALTFTVICNGITLYQKVFSDNDVGLQTVDFATSDLGSVLFTLTRSSTLFYVSKLIVYENTGDVFAGFETGRHIILGDSWVATSGFGVIGAFEERFPNATFVNLGHGGDKASDLWTRYNSDVLGEVATNGLASSLMIIVGTNDYFAGTTPAAFGGYISSMVSKTVALGMIPIVFTSSVGSADVDTGRFNLSRRYVDEVAYYDQDYEWRDYTPTITASSGTISSVSATARYKVVGRLCYFKATVVITSKGTGAGILNVTTPFFGGATPANCRAGSALAVATWSGANITVVSATGSTIIADSTTVYIAGFNEI